MCVGAIVVVYQRLSPGRYLRERRSELEERQTDRQTDTQTHRDKDRDRET